MIKNKVRAKLLEQLGEKQNIDIISWVEKYRILAKEGSSEFGHYKFDKANFQIEPLQAVCEPKIKMVCIQGATQLIKTETLLNTMAYFIDVHASPTLVLQQDDSFARDFSRERIEPLITNCQRLKDKFIGWDNVKEKNQTILNKKFTGGFLTIRGVQNAKNLASRAVRLILADEVDRWVKDVSGEGDPIRLAMKRLATYFNSKIVVVSSPNIKNQSNIEYWYNKSDMRVYEVACPECKYEQELLFENLKFDSKNLTDVEYQCIECKSLIPESKKNDMVKNGKWKKKSETKNIAGFKISELYSYFRTWKEIVKEFLESKDDPIKLKTFINTTLAETYSDKNDSQDPSKFKRKSGLKSCIIPESAGIVIGGADIQADRIEINICSYGPNNQYHCVDYHVIYGDPFQEEIWAELNKFLQKKYYKKSGGSYEVLKLFIDSGFSTHNAYKASRFNDKIICVKGASYAQNKIISSPKFMDVDYQNKIVKNGVKLYLIDVGKIKQQIFSYVNIENAKKPNYMSFNDDLGIDYFNQFFSEKMERVVTKRGFERQEFKKIRERNEVLDCNVYCRAGTLILELEKLTEIDWENFVRGVKENPIKKSTRELSKGYSV